MNYQVTHIDRAQREARIAQSVKTATKYEDFHFFRDQVTQLPIVRIEIDLPIYRVENFRTFSEQAEYIVREHKPEDFFRSGQENESVQQTQHGILAKLAAKGIANSVVPILDVLQNEGQREPLLITHTGVVVNGNRRLAGMRELFTKDSQTHKQFSHVNCMVLPPDATSDDILDIEAVLQARPETRLDYDWIGDAQLLSALLQTKGSADAVAKRLGRKVAEVKNVLQALGEADMYLKEWANAAGEYSRVAEDGEQLFKDLPGLVQGKPAALQDGSRAIAWALFDNRRKLDGRLYNYNVAIGKRAEDVLYRLSQELDVSLATAGAGADVEFDFDLGEDTGQVNYQPLIDIFKMDERRDDAIEALAQICSSVIESEKDKRSGNAALKAISAANARLAEVDLSRASTDTYDALEKQLISVIQRATGLKDKLAIVRQSSDQGK